MSSVDVVAIAPDGGLTAGAPQWVAFKSHVARWNGTTRQWVIVASSDWKSTTATEISGTSDTWWNFRTGRWESGATTFSIRMRGYYTVWAEYLWYRHYGDPGGYVGTIMTPFHADLM